MNNLPSGYVSPDLNLPKTRLVKRWQYVLLSLLGLILAITVWGLFNITKVRDWYILATYKPPAVVQQLAVVDTMTSYARQLFYVNKPVVASSSVFAANCPSGSNHTHVIGCYLSGDNGIYLLNVGDPRLNGIIPVTAAYEMLHAGYARLSRAMRSQIDQAMWQFYTQHNLSPEIKQQMASYAVSEPGARYDELYSVLGTEVSNLPAMLENHYKLYFNNRTVILSAYNGYQAAFNSREQAIASDNAQLTSLRAQINSLESQLNALLANINAEQGTLSSDRGNGNQAGYNAAISSYNAMVNQYNSLVESVTADINQYNAIVSASNSLALEERQLVQAISSTPSKQISK